MGACKLTITISCAYCSSNFEIYKSQKDRRKYCSRECKGKDNRKGRTTCKQCGDDIPGGTPADRKFCSRKCYGNNKKKGEYRECPVCGEEFWTQPSWDYEHCSPECSAITRSRNNQVKFECEYCGDTESIAKWKAERKTYCSLDCAYCDDNRDLVNCTCKRCGKVFERHRAESEPPNYCSKECQLDELHENICGENHWNWKGGWDDYFGENWFSQRSKALERDDYECQVCGIGKDELGRKPSVHHIKPQRLFESKEESNNLSNLVTLCEKHHNKVEGWGLAPANVLD